MKRKIIEGDYFLLDGTFVEKKDAGKGEKNWNLQINFFASWNPVDDVGLFFARGQALITLNTPGRIKAEEAGETYPGLGDGDCIVLERIPDKPNGE